MNFIINPVSGESYPLYSEKGVNLLKNYVLYYQNGGSAESYTFESIDSADDSDEEEHSPEKNTKENQHKIPSRNTKEGKKFYERVNKDLSETNLRLILQDDKMSKRPGASNEEKKNYKKMRNKKIMDFIPNLEELQKKLPYVFTLTNNMSKEKRMHGDLLRKLSVLKDSYETAKEDWKKRDLEKLAGDLVDKDISILNNIK